MIPVEVVVVVLEGMAVRLLVGDRFSDGYRILTCNRNIDHLAPQLINHLPYLYWHIDSLLYAASQAGRPPRDVLLLHNSRLNYFWVIFVDRFLLVLDPGFVDGAVPCAVLTVLVHMAVLVLVHLYHLCRQNHCWGLRCPGTLTMHNRARDG